MRDALFFSKLRVLLCGWRWKHPQRGSWLKARLRRLRRFTERSSRNGLRDSRLTPHPSRFLIEPLEPRLLLAADLTGLVQSAALIDPAVPTNNASAIVQVQNIGNQRVNQSQVGVYASLDTTLDGSDILLGTANTGRINAGQSKNVTVNFDVPNSLNPVAYKMLAKVDNANAIVENSESNNVAIGGAINVSWKFGNVPGRSGNTTLTLRDVDGTNVTFRLSGPGLGEVIRDGTNWDVKVTGTDATSSVTILTNSVGNGRVTLNDIHVFGPLASFTAATTDLTGTLAIDGPVNIPGLLPGTITLGSIQGGTVAVPSVEELTILGSTTNAKFFIGTTLGQDGQLGGSGTNADTYGAGNIGLFTVAGSMTGTAVRVGINPVDGIYSNGNDVLVGGTASSIGGIVIGGSLSADTRFYAGAFPARYLHGLTLKPTAGDFHFISNFSGPSLSAALQQDTGSSATDQLTNNPAITGSVTDPQGIQTFVAGFGATPTFNILADRQANGSFTLSRARLEQINGASLTDGTYVLKLQATDTAGNSTQISVPFTLDTQAPTLSFDLAEASDTAPLGDQTTTVDLVTLIGLTEPLGALLLLETGATTQADAGGSFTFANVALALGANSFTIRATDQAGNQRTEIRTITRMAVGNNEAPVVVGVGGTLAYTEGDAATVIDATLTITDVDDTNIESATVTISAGNVPTEDVLAFTAAFGITGTYTPATGVLALAGSATLAQYESVLEAVTYQNTNTDNPNAGTRTITWVVNDGNLNSAGVTSTITVAAVNDAPVAGADTLAATEDTPVTYAVTDLVGNDTDVDSAGLSIASVTSGTGGTAVLNANGTVTFTPNANFNGPADFTYTVTDGALTSNTATVTVNVAAVNDAPVAGADTAVSVAENQTAVGTFAAVDPDVVDTVTYSLSGADADLFTITAVGGGELPCGAGLRGADGCEPR